LSNNILPRIKVSDVGYHGSSESPMQILHMKSRVIDLGKVGIIATSLTDLYLNERLEKYLYEYMRYGTALAMLHGIGGGQTETALQIRELSPYLDLLDGRGNRIGHNQWIQRPSMVWDHQIEYNNPKRDSISIYQTSKESANDKKVILIYGFEFMNGFNKTKVDEIQIWRKAVQILGIYPLDKNKRHPLFKGVSLEDPLQELEILDIEEKKDSDPKTNYTVLSNRHNLVYHNNIMLFNTPILVKKDYNIDIRFVYPNGHAPCLSEVNEEIKIKGLVFEALGESLGY
jgi:hypothetical protein